MKIYLLLVSFLTIAVSLKAQDYTYYENSIKRTLYSKILKDSVQLELTIPKELKKQTNISYPVIYLLDRQLNSNYVYNLHTIDYLSSLNSMPSVIVVGITFDRKNRIQWTLPNASGGKADDLISFLINELNVELKNSYPISKFNLLIGHSRTAIFSSYALSKRFDFFNGAIANSVSDFDFGDSLQKMQFETFIDAIDTCTNKYFYYFSVGENAYGDLHESSVDKLDIFLNSRKLPKTLEWRYYKYKAAHQVTPGLTVANALNEIFKEYGRRIEQCFKIAHNSPQKVAWNEYMKLYESISTDLGYTIRLSHSFFSSISSDYYFDYKNYYGKNNLRFALEVLLKAIEVYPKDYDYSIWAGEIYITLNDYKNGSIYLNRSVKLINEDNNLTEADRKYLLTEIEDLRKMIK